MLSAERQNDLLKLLAERQRISSHELQELFPASPATMRRDLAALEARGLLVRVHGGVLHPHAFRGEMPFAARSQRHADRKQSIAARAVELIGEVACVYIDGGSACLQVGLRLLDREGLTLVTNSIPLVQAAQGAAARIICLGGELKQVSMALVGSQALAEVGRLRPDVAILGASGLHPEDGPSTTDLLEANLKSQAIARAGRALLVAESAKWNHPAAFGFARWAELAAFVSDSELPPEARLLLQAAGVAVHCEAA